MYKNIENKNITILGAGISGIGAAKLANHLGANVLVSDKNSIKINEINEDIKIELGEHTDKCFNCDFVILSPGINPGNKFIELFEQKNIPIFSEIEFASWFTKSKIIGITGSNGKSTTVKIIENLLKTKFSNTLTGGNIGVSFSQNVLIEIENELTNVIHLLELSSFQLEKITSFKPNIACFLNLSSDHLDRHLSLNEYFQAKNNIIKNYAGNTIFLFNEDDKYLEKKYNKYNYMKFSIKNSKNKIFIKNGSVISDRDDGDIIDYNNTILKGNHNLENVIAAITIAKLMKISNLKISTSLKTFEPLKHRLEKVKSNNSITYINDSKATNIKSTIEAIRSSSKNTILILGGYSKGKVNYQMHFENILKNVKHIICYGQEGKYIYKTIHEITDSIIYINDFTKATLYAIKIAEKNDRVLLSPACASYDQFKNFEERGDKFKNIIRKYYA